MNYISLFIILFLHLPLMSMHTFHDGVRQMPGDDSSSARGSIFIGYLYKGVIYTSDDDAFVADISMEAIAEKRDDRDQLIAELRKKKKRRCVIS